jgi:hypothetical protein
LRKRTESELLAPRLTPLSDEQRREAAGLLAELLLDVARKRAGVPSGGGFDGVMGSASGGVASPPDEGVRPRRAA